MKTVQITLEVAKRILNTGVCPCCMNFRIVKVFRTRWVEGEERFAGSFFACGGEKGSQCWNMNDTGNKSIRMTRVT